MSEINFAEIHRLHEKLEKAGIPYEFIDMNMEYPDVGYGGYQILYPNADEDERIASAVIHKFSYGHQDGLIELLMTPPKGNKLITGFLTADEVFERIRDHFCELLFEES